jgi:hypothetical protein
MRVTRGFDIYDINMAYKMQFNAQPQSEIPFLKLK